MARTYSSQRSRSIWDLLWGIMDAAWITALSFLLLVIWDVHPVLLILAATIFGAFVYAR